MLRNKLLSIVLCLLVLLSSVGAAPAWSASVNYTAVQVQSLCDGIIAYKGSNSPQSFIDHYLTQNAGSTAEFYAIALSQSGNYDFSRYVKALKSYLNSHEVYSASSREKYALALAAAGSTDNYIDDTADEAIGGLGLMSLVFGLHLLNNGYDSDLYSIDGLISEILSRQMNDGGWAVMGSYGDVDVTAMTLQALAQHYGYRGDVSSAIDRGVDFLSKKQLDSGGFKTMGAENCESAAQVVIALSALGIDAQYDGRFVKSGNSAMTGMMQFYCSDGGFSHAGGGSNESATIEAFCALTAYRRYCYGQGSLYLLDHVDHAAPQSDPQDDRAGDPGSGNGQQSQNKGNSRSSSSSGHGGDGYGKGSGSNSDDHALTDDNGNRIIVINGRKYIEATTASGEKMTVAVSETQGTVNQTATQARPTYGGFQPSATADMKSVRRISTADGTGEKGSYKPYAILGVILLSGGICLVLFLMKKRNKKHYIAVALIAAAGVLFILLTDFQSTESHRQPAKTDGDISVTLTIRCDTIKDHADENEFVPADGIILDVTTFYAEQGDTVYDILEQAVSARNIPMDNRGSRGAAYIAGLNALYEFQYGDLSGWMYRVNGAFPDVGCQSYTVSDGDRIEWLYTTNIGKDLE